MAPTRVTKNQDSPNKSPNKSPSKSALNEANLLFLWLSVHHNKGNAPDYKAVAEKMKIALSTSYYRYNQLKSYFESMGVSEGGVEKEPSTGGPETPRKTPRKTKRKTPKKVDDDEPEQEGKPVLKMEGVVIKNEEDQENKPGPDVKMEDDTEV